MPRRFGAFTLRWVKLAIIGAGSLGTALGERYSESGHTVMFGGGASAQDAAARLRALVGSDAEADAFGDVVILAVPFAAIDAALADAAPLRGRVVWSCVHAVKPDYTGLAIGFDDSGARRRSPEGRRGRAWWRPFLRLLTRSRRDGSATTVTSSRRYSSAAMTPPPSEPSRV